jgi:flavorubredoxin
MTIVLEIAPDLYRLSTYVSQIGMQFNQFLMKDDEPLPFHTGFKWLFPQLRDVVATIVDPARLRWLGFSHFEADECGALNSWLDVAPQAQATCSQVGALVSVNDFAIRPARPLTDGEVLTTGRYRFRFLKTPHVPPAGKPGSYSRRLTERYSARTYFITTATRSPSPSRMWWTGRRKR